MTWYDDNETRAFPLVGQDDFEIPPDVIVDALVYAPQALGSVVNIRSISVTPLLVSVIFCIGATDVAYATQLQSDIAPYQTVALTPLTAGVSGFVVFGSGIQRLSMRVDGSYPLVPESLITYQMDLSTVTASVGGHTLTGLVKLQAGSGLALAGKMLRIKKEDTSIVTTMCVVLSITDDRIRRDAIPASQRPADANPGALPITVVNGVRPDSGGNLVIVVENILENEADPKVAVTGVQFTDEGTPCG